MEKNTEYKMIDGKLKRVEVDNVHEETEVGKDKVVSREDIELELLKLKTKELHQRIETERKVSNLAFPLTILAWVTIVALVINILVIIAYV